MHRPIDIRNVQGRDGIERAWKAYELREISRFNVACKRVQITRERFNSIAAQGIAHHRIDEREL